MKYYPAFIDLNGRKAVVVGGGRVAERKVRTLLGSGASVTVISPDITPALERLRRNSSIIYVPRKYRRSDVRNAFLVIAATSSREVNKRIASESPFLVNVADPPEEGNFTVPSSVSRGELTIAVSTGGASPAVAMAVRKELQRTYDAEFARYLRMVESLRKKAISDIEDTKARKRYLRELASDEMLLTLRSEGLAAVRKKILKLSPRQG